MGETCPISSSRGVPDLCLRESICSSSSRRPLSFSCNDLPLDGPPGKYFAAVGDNLDGAVLVGCRSCGTHRRFINLPASAPPRVTVYTSQIGSWATSRQRDGMTAIAACVIGGSASPGTGSFARRARRASHYDHDQPRTLVFSRCRPTGNNTISGLLLLTMVLATPSATAKLERRRGGNRLNARSRARERRACDEARA